MTNLPADDELIAYLDGELDPEARVEMERRLAASWELRQRLAGLERDIEIYMRETAEAVEPELPPATQMWQRLEKRIEWAEAPARPRWKRRALVGGIAAAILLAAFLRLRTAPSISAAEALEKARMAEAVRLGSVLRPVVHRKMQVRRTGLAQPQVWELWSASTVDRVREAGHGAVVQELREVFRRNGMDPNRPLSPVAFSEWRKRIEPRHERVERRNLEDGREALKVTTEAAAVEASLTLRPADWQVVEQEITVQTAAGPTRYEIKEVEFAVLAYASLPPAFFGPASTLPRPIPLRNRVIAPPPAPLPPPPAEPSQLLSAALMAHAALHRAGACADEAIEIARVDPDRVDVRGTLATAERKATLLEAFGQLPLLRLDLQVGTPAAVSGSETLMSALQARQAIQESTAISLASVLRAIGADSGAIRRHVQGFREPELLDAPVGLHAQFRKAIEEHLLALRANLAQAASLLGAEVAADPAAHAPEDWHAAVLALTAAVSTSCSEASALETTSHRLAAACADLSGRAAHAETVMAAAFAARPANSASRR